MSTTRRRPRAGAGFALVSAIFLLVALAALGAFVLSVSTAQHAGAALDVRGAHAYYAARAGSEWGAARTAVGAFCAANPSSNIGSVNGVAVTVECATLAAGGAVEFGLGKIYAIVATACTHPAAGACPGDASTPNYVERRISLVVERQ